MSSGTWEKPTGLILGETFRPVLRAIYAHFLSNYISSWLIIQQITMCNFRQAQGQQQVVSLTRRREKNCENERQT